MHTPRPMFRSIFYLLCLLFGLWGTALAVPNATKSTPTGKLDREACLQCHDSQKDKIKVPVVIDDEDDERELRRIDVNKFAKSVHSSLQCVDCHTNVVDAQKNHQLDKNASKASCAGCHQSLWDKAQKDGTTKDKPRLELVAKNIEAYKASFHALENKNMPGFARAVCDDCHTSHEFNIPPKGSEGSAAWHQSIPQTCGSKCHEDQLKVYSSSIHGKELIDKGNIKSAVCTDCHSAHSVTGTSSDAFRLANVETCGTCHQAENKSYKDTYHGQVNKLGYAYTARCVSCHDSHGIKAVADPKSKVHADNRMKTCEKCHDGKKDLAKAPTGFASFQPHGHANDFKRYPEIWVAWQIMLQLLVGTFGFFWLHTLLWFYREFKERQQRKSQPHVKLDGLPDIPAKMHGKHFQRFSLTWRIAHLSFALSLMILTLTGIPLLYPEAPWARPLMSLLGGPHIAGSIHRVNAVIFAGVFFWHLAYMGLKIGRDWKNFKIFGPNSMIPGLQDLKDIIAMFKWFFGKAPRPIFDRWTYWEKFDYWAPFWGVTIIGVSGLMMWFPNVTGQYLPGWAFNVAAIFHGEEAFLAVVFLFTVHFFNNHFRPDKFPLERVMFTGTVTLDDLKHDHPLQYKRLLESGELEKHLVDAPSPAMYKASTILGFTLIVMGLTLLTLVGIGFFTSL